MNLRPTPPHRHEFDGPEWLTPQQAAEALGLPVAAVYPRLRRGQFPATQDRSKLWHIRRGDLDRVRVMGWYQASIARRS